LYISNLKKVSFIALSLANSLLRINKECHKVVNLLFVTVQKPPPCGTMQMSTYYEVSPTDSNSKGFI
jgi:hypothetical protein